jgi:hypothetical protein
MTSSLEHRGDRTLGDDEIRAVAKRVRDGA